MQSEYIYPENSDRTSPKEWNENGRPEILDNAQFEVKKILDNFITKHISNELNSKILKDYNILFKVKN